MSLEAHAGGCVCGAVRYETLGEPMRVWLCHCRFCQRATGSAGMVEPTFPLERLRVTHGAPARHDHRSEGSGRLVHIHFCAACGTKLYLTFERFPTGCGIYAGTYDDPGWFRIGPDNAKQIFIGMARPDSVLLPGIPAFHAHAFTAEGEPIEPVVFEAPLRAGNQAASSGPRAEANSETASTNRAHSASLTGSESVTMPRRAR